MYPSSLHSEYEAILEPSASVSEMSCIQVHLLLDAESLAATRKLQHDGSCEDNVDIRV